MSNQETARPESRKLRPQQRQWYAGEAGDEPAVEIPQWVKDWGWLPAILGAIMFLFLAVTAGWLPALAILTFTGGVIALNWRKSLRKKRSAWAERRRQQLCARACLEKADLMDGTQFEWFTAALLSLRGCEEVQVVGRSGGDGGVDILAVDPGGQLVAIQCKRQLANIPVHVIRELIGAISEDFRGRAGVLDTTASLTAEANALSGRCSRITVIDRAALARWMVEARCTMEQQSHLPPDAQRSVQLQALRFITEIVIDEQASTQGGEPPTPSTPLLVLGRPVKASVGVATAGVALGAIVLSIFHMASVSKHPTAERPSPVSLHGCAEAQEASRDSQPAGSTAPTATKGAHLSTAC